MKRSELRQYHEANPHLWKHFAQEATRMIQAGATYLSARQIFENLRQRPDLEKVGSFKVNNNFIPYYAEAYMSKYPSTRGLFRQRGTVVIVEDEIPDQSPQLELALGLESAPKKKQGFDVD